MSQTAADLSVDRQPAAGFAAKVIDAPVAGPRNADARAWDSPPLDEVVRALSRDFNGPWASCSRRSQIKIYPSMLDLAGLPPQRHVAVSDWIVLGDAGHGEPESHRRLLRRVARGDAEEALPENFGRVSRGESQGSSRGQRPCRARWSRRTYYACSSSTMSHRRGRAHGGDRAQRPAGAERARRTWAPVPGARR